MISYVFPQFKMYMQSVLVPGFLKVLANQFSLLWPRWQSVKESTKLLNRVGKAGGGHANSAKDINVSFTCRHLWSMATIGSYKALVDIRQSKDSKGLSLKGFPSWLIWRSAYLTRVISWRNRFYVAINWLTTLLLGRDIS